MDPISQTTERQTWIPARRHTGMTEGGVTHGNDGECHAMMTERSTCHDDGEECMLG